MRTKLIACTMALALVAAAGVGTASATAKEVVLEVNGNPLPPGAPLHGETFDPVVTDVKAKYYCVGTFEGEVLAKPNTFEIYEDDFFFPAPEEEKQGCFTTNGALGGLLNLTFAEPVTLTYSEKTGIRALTPGVIEWKGCKYETSFLTTVFFAEGGIIRMRGGGAFKTCLGGATFEADFTLTSNGKPVAIAVI